MQETFFLIYIQAWGFFYPLKLNKHNALIDCHLLKEVYVNLVDQKEPKLNLENAEVTYSSIDKIDNKSNKLRKVIKPTAHELEMHKKYLKVNLPKNYFN